MRFEERVIDEVASLNDIVEVVSGYLPLKRSGRTFKALCPFHQEKTPSFIVHPEKQIFHCFGCGAGGNVFSFLMKYENLTFPEALRNLAGRVNFPLPEPTRRTTEEVSESEALYEIYRLAGEYYAENLKSPQKGERARTYLAQRGFGEEIAKEFALGWATPDWRGLFEFLVKHEIKDSVIFRSGLVLRSREGSPYDLFRGRLLFPIFNLQGKIIAFGGRGLEAETPKYLNSPESPVFRKRRELYGLHASKRHLSTTESRIYIVEGYFDFLRVYTCGFKNVAATLGTSLTEDHVRVLKRFVQEAVVIYDGDEAGESAALRGLEVFLEGEMSVKVVTLPKGKDPDSFIKEEGPAAFQTRVDEAQDFFDFKWRMLTRRHSVSDSGGLLRISTEFLEIFTKIKNPILLDRYLKKLAGSLGVGEATLRERLSELQKKRERTAGETTAKAPSVSRSIIPSFPEEGILLALLLEDAVLWEKGAEALSVDDFRHPAAKEAFQIFKQNRATGSSSAYQKLFNRLEEESIKSFVAAHSIRELTPNEREKAFSDCLKKVKRRRIEEKLEKLRRAIADAEGTGEKSRLEGLLDEYRSLLIQRS